MCPRCGAQGVACTRMPCFERCCEVAGTESNCLTAIICSLALTTRGSYIHSDISGLRTCGSEQILSPQLESRCPLAAHHLNRLYKAFMVKQNLLSLIQNLA